MILSISLLSTVELKFFIFLIIVFFGLNFGPIFLPIKKPKLDAALYPMVRKIMNKMIIAVNSKK